MIEIVDKSRCSGCSACQAVCPKSCVALVADEEGFAYPKVDRALCVDCGKCEAVCPILNAAVKPSPPPPGPDAFAAYNRDGATREKSSSGGLFYLLAREIIKKGGVVFGAKFDDDFRVVHDYAETLDGVEAFQGSKYVQSDVGATFKRAKEFLKEGRAVLFTGTPCQIGGLKAFLGKEYDNLYCQDIICHGVPSPKIWKKYVEFREGKSASKTRRIFFRRKNCGWKKFSVLFEFSNNTEYLQDLSKDLYMRSFLRDLTLRKSCCDCAFKSQTRQADVTLADYWGVQNIHPELDDDRGTSLILLHSEKGRALFDAIRDEIVCRETDLAKAVVYNPALIRSARRNPKRDRFLQKASMRPFDQIVRKYCKDGVWLKLKRSLWRAASKAKRVAKTALRRR